MKHNEGDEVLVARGSEWFPAHYVSQVTPRTHLVLVLATGSYVVTSLISSLDALKRGEHP